MRDGAGFEEVADRGEGGAVFLVALTQGRLFPGRDWQTHVVAAASFENTTLVLQASVQLPGIIVKLHLQI